MARRASPGAEVLHAAGQGDIHRLRELIAMGAQVSWVAGKVLSPTIRRDSRLMN